jgi:hypothetical protein
MLGQECRPIPLVLNRSPNQPVPSSYVSEPSSMSRCSGAATVGKNCDVTYSYPESAKRETKEEEAFPQWMPRCRGRIFDRFLRLYGLPTPQ